MNWFYALGGQQQGPVNDAQLDALLAAGTINADTLVWREGLSNWQPLRQARPAVPGMELPPVVAPSPAAPPTGASPPGPGEVQCAECGRHFTRENVIQYGTASVCAACKPIFLQRLREGAAPAETFTGLVNEEQLLAREYRIEIGDCLSRAWKLFSENVGIVIGVTLLMGVIYLGAAFAVGLLGAVGEAILPGVARFVSPFINQVLMAILTGPVAGGYFWFLLRLARREQAGIGDAFAGFSRRFPQLMFCSLAQGMVQLICMAPLLILMAAAGVSTTFGRGGTPDFSPALLGGFVGAGLIAMIGMTYFGTVWTHSYLLVMDKGYKFWPALRLSFRLVHKRWWMTWVLLLVGGIIGGAGVLACCIGVLVTLPLYLAMRTWLYEDNFRDLARAEGA